jgi:hypothetical protein
VHLHLYTQNKTNHVPRQYSVVAIL